MNKENKILSFELDNQNKKVELHLNNEGLESLIEMLKSLSKRTPPDHLHLMTEEWGGSELTNIKQGENNETINHVKVFLWGK